LVDVDKAAILDDYPSIYHDIANSAR